MTTLVMPVDAMSPTMLAERVRDTRERAEAAEVELLRLAVAWADAHPELDDDGDPVPPERVDDYALAAHFAGLDPEEELDTPAWAGLPPVAWDAPAGLATACGFSTRAGRALLRDVLVLRHRLPLVWRRVRAGEVQAWRARRIAQEVAGAPDDVVAAIDAVVAPLADRAGQATLRSLVAEAMLRLYPDEVEAASLEALDSRYVRFDRELINHTGVTSMDIRADYADLHDFDAALTALAGVLEQIDPAAAHESLQVRRARALGVISDPALSQRLLAGAQDEGSEDGPSDPITSGPPRPTSKSGRRFGARLELRISDLALLGLDPLGYHVSAGFPTLAERVAEWCGRSTADLTVLPVLDPDAHASTEAYAARGRLRDHIDLRDRHCLFPFCTRPARVSDHDHEVPYDEGGASCTCNLVPLCRHHHRLKTHAGYQSTSVEPGVVWWLTPHGHEFVVDEVGTLPVHRAPPSGDGCLRGSAHRRQHRRLTT